MSEVAESQVAGGTVGAGSTGGSRSGQITPVIAVIAITTALALALRVYYQSTRAGFLLGVTEYDDGPYFGSALRLASGALPYRDFFLVQPPGITLLLAPVALIARVTGTAVGLEIARILTTMASGAAVVLSGLLVRRYGTVAVLITCGIVAVHPLSIAAAHTVLVEPWLVLFCLAGALLLFDGDRLATGWRQFWAGVAFGFAGAVEAWAIVPVLVAILLFLPRIKRAWRFCAGVAAGFLVPVLPFVALAPRQFYQSVIVAQIQRVSPARAAVWERFANILGIVSPTPGQQAMVLAIAITLAVAAAAAIAAASLVSRRPPPLLERFVVLTTLLVVIMFCLADQFYYHFVAFLAPFLGASIALPVARLVAGTAAGRRRARQSGGSKTPASGAADVQPLPPRTPGRRIAWRLTAALAAVAIAVVAVTQFKAESGHANVIGPAPRAIDRIIPPGACVLTDQVSMTIVAERFYSNVPGCPLIIDGLATDLALSHGKKPSDGAGSVPAVAALWRQAFARAQFVLLSPNNTGRIAWTPALTAYLHENFVRIRSHWKRVALYRRRGLPFR